MGLYRDNGKENGNYYLIRLHRYSGKENGGSYVIGLYASYIYSLNTRSPYHVHVYGSGSKAPLPGLRFGDPGFPYLKHEQ